MKPGYLNEISASFYLWLDNRILKEGAAFVNHSGKLEKTFDPFFSSYEIYGSRYRQWVSDTDISGAVIASGIWSGSNFLPKSSGEIMIDYNMGRAIISPSFFSGSGDFSAIFSFKEFNIYPTSKDDIEILFGESENFPSNIGTASKVLDYNEQPFPCIFVKFEMGENKPFAFGGIDEANWRIRCTVLADSAYKLDACLSILSDCAHQSFRRISSHNLPFNVFGDVKPPEIFYSYTGTVSKQTDQDWIFIKSVEISKFPEKVNTLIKNDIWGAFADFSIQGLKNV